MARHRELAAAISCGSPIWAIRKPLTSMPPLARWEYDAHFAAGSEEAQLADWLKPNDWLKLG